MREESKGGGWRPLAAALAGAALAGLGALHFAVVEERATALRTLLWGASPYWLFVLMPAALWLIIYLRDRHFPGTDGTGIPQTIAALKAGPGAVWDRLLSPRVAIGKIILTTMGLLAFLSIGREGPSVQLGACCMRLAGGWAKFPAHLARRGLVLAGGAAGIAAAFNAPIAGIIFSCEEIGRSFEKENMGTLVRTVVAACAVCAIHFGNTFFFGRIDYGRAIPVEFLNAGPWLAVIGIGALGGLLGGLFASLLLFVTPLVTRAIKRRLGPVAIAIGLASAALAVGSGGLTLGSGYDQTRALILQGSPEYTATLPPAEQARIAETALQIGPGYPLMRAASSLLVLSTRIPGGLFDPSFSVGASLGKICAPLLAWTGAPSQAVVLLFVVAYFSGVVQAPLTAFVILIEMTGSVAFTLPLAAAAIIACEVSRKVCPVALYQALAESFLHNTADAAK